MSFQFPFVTKNRTKTEWIAFSPDLVLFLRLFYACAFLRLSFGLAPDFLGRDLHHVSYLWPLGWIPLFSDSVSNLIPYLIVFSAGSFLGLSALFPTGRPFRIVGSFLLLLVLALRFSFGEVGHSNFIWGLCAIFLCWCKVDDSDFWKRMNAAWILGACSFLCSFYFLASLYKIESYIRVLLLGQNWYSTLASFIPIQLWHAYLFGELNRPPLGIFQEPSLFTAVCTLMVLLFQLSTLVPILNPRLFRMWAVFLIGFHAFNLILLETNFLSAVFLILVLLGFHPLQERERTLS